MQYTHYLTYHSLPRLARSLRSILGLSFFVAIMATSLPAAAIIQYEATSLGVNVMGQRLFHYDYTLSGIDLTTNAQHDPLELDIQFDPSIYVQLYNGVASPAFDLLLFQPNNPPGAAGLYSALALIDQPSTSATFSVDVVVATSYTGPLPPGGQTWFVENDVTLETLMSGTVMPPPSSVPEPSALSLCGIGLLLGGGLMLRRRFAAST